MSFSYSLSVPKMSDEVKRHSIHGITVGTDIVKPHQEIGHLSFKEKHYLLAVERGDIVSVNRALMQNNVEESLRKPVHLRTININCIDPLGRSAIMIAIDNENYEMLKLLIANNVDTKDALLYAVSEEFVEAVELLLDCEEERRKPGEIHASYIVTHFQSWERRPQDTAIFSSDITPLILAAHRDNYEIIKILLDRGASLPIPHDSRCNCNECVTLSMEDSLLHSHCRINAYRALSSPFLIVLSSKDPILTAFELSWALRRLSKLEHEFKSDYEQLRNKCQKFATDLLNHTRSSYELEILLNYNVDNDSYRDEKTVRLHRLRLAVKLKQKEFVAHPNVQQLLASIWYAGLPGFRRKNTLLQTFEVFKIGLLFPPLSLIYILTPSSYVGKMMRTPFIKFICHSASYFLFLFLIMVSTMMPENQTTKPIIMYTIGAFVIGLLWTEVKSLWRDGPQEYVADMWNIVDFVTTALYISDMGLQAFLYCTKKGLGIVEHMAQHQDREDFDLLHPILVSEALFSTAIIFSTLKVVYIFSINPYLGPLQIVLGRVILDIAKFFLLYVLVLLAFTNGIHQLLSPYSEIQKKWCNTDINETAKESQDRDQNCRDTPYEKFNNLFETVQVLFWTAFGEIHLDFFSLRHIKVTTKFWGMFMYGSFCVICLVVLLNLLIAMMDHSYNQIFDDADVEWKFARSKLWISYFDEGGTAPVPFNVIPSPKSFWYFMKWIYCILCPELQEDARSKSIQNVMKNLVQRYVIARQKKGSEHNTVTEDDINEVKQEILSFRSDMIQILRESGMMAKRLKDYPAVLSGKKNRFKERRLIKGLNMEFSESVSDSREFTEIELEKSLLEDDKRNDFKHPLSELLNPIFKKRKKIKSMFSRAMSKQSWGSSDDVENDLKTPDSIQLNGNYERRVWFNEPEPEPESPLPPEIELNEKSRHERDSDFSYIDDSLESHHNQKR